MYNKNQKGWIYNYNNCMAVHSNLHVYMQNFHAHACSCYITVNACMLLYSWYLIPHTETYSLFHSISFKEKKI